jgi:hypothetical protein
MSDHEITDADLKVWKRLERFGLKQRPLHDPLGDNHHTDMPFLPEDIALADDLAWFMGTIGWLPRSEESSVEQWRRVVRALRHHGLKLTNRRIKKNRETGTRASAA